MQLRDYQRDALNAVWRDLKESNRALCVLPTGGGKTECFIKLVEHYLKVNPGKRALVLVNKIKLLEQTERRFKPIFGDQIGIYCGSAGLWNTSKPVTIASIQSIYDIKIDDLGLIVLDEVHNVDQGAGRYKAFLDSHAEAWIAAFTATPFRSDGVIYGTDSMFPKISYQKFLPEMMQEGFLVQPTMKRPEHQYEIEKLRVRAGEFMAEDVAKLVGDRSKIRKQIGDAIPRMLSRKSIVWACANIMHCEAVQEALLEIGEQAVKLHSEMSSAERDASQADFESGRARHLVFVSIVSEGYDYPPIDCVVLMRPIKSPVLYVQTVGRGLRPAEGKENLLVLDYGKVIETIGPLDKPIIPKKGKRKAEKPAIKACPECFEYVPSATLQCPVCQFCFKIERSPLKSMTTKARDGAAILSSLVNKTREMHIRAVELKHHASKAGNQCLKIVYYPDNLIEPAISEFFTWSHDWAYKSAQRRLIEMEVPLLESLADQVKVPVRRIPRSIIVDVSGQYPKVKKICF